MTRDEMEQFLATFLRKRSEPLQPPTEEEWNALGRKFACTFGNDFRNFMELASTYEFPDNIFEVGNDRPKGDGGIGVVYDLERTIPGWKSDMIPFYGLGTGDYFCLNAKECPESPVYFRDHEQLSDEVHSPSFEAFVLGLPEFCA